VVHTDGYRIGRCAVTNAEFAEFLAASGHISSAVHFGWSFALHLLLPTDFHDTRGVAAAPSWREVHFADWKHPEGEWCADSFHPTSALHDSRTNPAGPPDGDRPVMRGGSYLCRDSYCDRYRVSAHTANEPDATTGDLGFRMATDFVR